MSSSPDIIGTTQNCSSRGSNKKAKFLSNSNMPGSSDLTSSPAWTALQSHYDMVQSVTMKDLFAQDPSRFDKFSTKFQDDNDDLLLLLDYSKNFN